MVTHAYVRYCKKGRNLFVSAKGYTYMTATIKQRCNGDAGLFTSRSTEPGNPRTAFYSPPITTHNRTHKMINNRVSEPVTNPSKLFTTAMEDSICKLIKELNQPRI